MEQPFELLDVDWITAKMYGKTLIKRKNEIPLSKNGIEPLEEIEEELDSLLDVIDNKLFTKNKEFN